jgi:hypothetical protein
MKHQKLGPGCAVLLLCAWSAAAHADPPRTTYTVADLRIQRRFRGGAFAVAKDGGYFCLLPDGTIIDCSPDGNCTVKSRSVASKTCG